MQWGDLFWYGPIHKLPGRIFTPTLSLLVPEEFLQLLLIPVGMFVALKALPHFFPFTTRQCCPPLIQLSLRHDHCGWGFILIKYILLINLQLSCALGMGVSWDQLWPAQGNPGHPVSLHCCSGPYIRCHHLHLNFFSISIKFKTHLNKNEVILKVQCWLFPLFLLSISPLASTEVHCWHLVPRIGTNFLSKQIFCTKSEVQTAVLFQGGRQARLFPALWRGWDWAPSLAVAAPQSTEGHKQAKGFQGSSDTHRLIWAKCCTSRGFNCTQPFPFCWQGSEVLIKKADRSKCHKSTDAGSKSRGRAFRETQPLPDLDKCCKGLSFPSCLLPFLPPVTH